MGKREWLIEVNGTGKYRCYELDATDEQEALDTVSRALRREGVMPPYVYQVLQRPSDVRQTTAQQPAQQPAQA